MWYEDVSGVSACGDCYLIRLCDVEIQHEEHWMDELYFNMANSPWHVFGPHPLSYILIDCSWYQLIQDSFTSAACSHQDIQHHASFDSLSAKCIYSFCWKLKRQRGRNMNSSSTDVSFAAYHGLPYSSPLSNSFSFEQILLQTFPLETPSWAPPTSHLIPLLSVWTLLIMWVWLSLQKSCFL